MPCKIGCIIDFVMGKPGTRQYLVACRSVFASVTMALATNACRSESSFATRASPASDAKATGMKTTAGPSETSVEPSRSELPLRMRLVAKRSVYQLGPEVALLKKELDRQGRLEEARNSSGKSPRERLKDQLEHLGRHRYPDPPAVELVLEITNRSQQPVEFWWRGDAVRVDLTMQGPGAITVSPPGLHTTELRIAEATRLGPGEIYRRPITRLAYGVRDDTEWAYWTQPGQYTLTASFHTGIHPPPAGMRVEQDEPLLDYARVVLVAPPITLDVMPMR
jgi:hypothetical protein